MHATLVDEGMRTEKEAVAMIDPRNLDTLLHPQFDAAALEGCNTSSEELLEHLLALHVVRLFSTAEDAEEWNAAR